MGRSPFFSRKTLFGVMRHDIWGVWGAHLGGCPNHFKIPHATPSGCTPLWFFLVISLAFSTHLGSAWHHLGTICQPGFQNTNFPRRKLVFVLGSILPIISQACAAASVLAPSWHHLGIILTPSWHQLGSACFHLGTILDQLGFILAPSGHHLGFPFEKRHI